MTDSDLLASLVSHFARNGPERYRISLMALSFP